MPCFSVDMFKSEGFHKCFLAFQINPQPTTSWTKKDIAAWLTEHKVEFDEKMVKEELYNLAKLHREPIR